MRLRAFSTVGWPIVRLRAGKHSTIGQAMTMLWIGFVGQLLMISSLQAQGMGGNMQNSYCAQFSDGTSPDCSYSNLQMCERSVTGVGGVCLNNPSGPTSPSAMAPQAQTPFSSSAVPPPPFAQQSSGPLPLPDASQAQSCNPLTDGTYCASASRQIQSLSNDLAIGQDPAATLGASTFSAGHNACIGLFGPSSCGG